MLSESIPQAFYFSLSKVEFLSFNLIDKPYALWL